MRASLLPNIRQRSARGCRRRTAMRSLKLSGSLLNETGYIGFRDDIPDGSTRDWYSQTSVTARLSQGGDKTRFFAALWTRFDAATGGWDLSLDEAWGEWSPTSFVSLRFGRFPLRYGPCVAFNPAKFPRRQEPLRQPREQSRARWPGAGNTAAPCREGRTGSSLFPRRGRRSAAAF